MVSRNRGFEAESVSDMLLFTTMCMIGHLVDVYVKDGSIYSGTFYTASVDNDYAIVLKKARMTKKGNLVANVANKGIIETLVVKSEDLAQVVSKGVLHSADGFTGNASGNYIGATSSAPSTVCSEKATQTISNGKHNVDRKRINQTRTSSKSGHGSTPKTMSHLHTVVDTGSGKTIGTDMSKRAEASSVANNTRNVGGLGSQQKLRNYEEKAEHQKASNTPEVQDSNSISDAPETQLDVATDFPKKVTLKVLPNNVHDSSICSSVKLHGAEDAPRSETIPSGVSASIPAAVNVTSELHLSLSKSMEMVPQKISNSNKTSKEFKLNPGAKIFSPSFAHQRSATPPVMPAATNMAYMPENTPVISISPAQPEVEISPFIPRSLPVKYVPYGGLVSGNGGSEMQYPQPVVGHMGSRTQPVRYAGHYHPVQAGTTYVHPTSQNLMVGRLGPLVYVQPVSHDVVQGAPAFSQVSNIPLLTPHQVHLSKHQGTAAAQTLQWCPSPPFIAAGQQPYAVPSHMPISQPHYPVIRPMPVPGSNGFIPSKFS